MSIFSPIALYIHLVQEAGEMAGGQAGRVGGGVVLGRSWGRSHQTNGSGGTMSSQRRAAGGGEGGQEEGVNELDPAPQVQLPAGPSDSSWPPSPLQTPPPAYCPRRTDKFRHTSSFQHPSLSPEMLVCTLEEWTGQAREGSGLGNNCGYSKKGKKIKTTACLTIHLPLCCGRWVVLLTQGDTSWENSLRRGSECALF